MLHINSKLRGRSHLPGCGAAHLGDAKASPAHFSLPAAAGGVREKDLNESGHLKRFPTYEIIHICKYTKEQNE